MNQAETKRRQIQAIETIFSLITLAIAARLTGYNGVTYVAVGLETYAMLYTVVCGGTTEALGRLLRVRNAKGQYRNAARIRRNVMLLQSVLGAVGTVVALLAATEIAEKLFRVQYSTFILYILAPAVFLRSVSAVLLGYSTGEGAELPTALACILRQVFILGFSLIFCRMLGDYGNKVSKLLVQENYASMYGGVGVAIAVTLAEVFIIIFLILMYRGRGRSYEKTSQEGMRTTVSFFDCVSLLCANRGVKAGTQLLSIIFLPLGLIFLQKISGGNEKAVVEYGVYIAAYGIICGIAVAFIIFLVMPMYSKVVSLIRRDEHRFARVVFQGGVHLIVVHACFMAVFLAMMAEQTAAVVCSQHTGTALGMFRVGSAVILFVALSFYFSRMLILMGKKYFVLAALAIGNVIYIVITAVLLYAGRMGIMALVYGGLIGSVVLCALLGVLAYRQIRQRIDWLRVLIIPAGAACVSGFLGMLLGKVLTPHVGNLVAWLVCLVVSGALFWAGLLLLRNFREQELEVMPGGRLINALEQMLHIL